MADPRRSNTVDSPNSNSSDSSSGPALSGSKKRKRLDLAPSELPSIDGEDLVCASADEKVLDHLTKRTPKTVAQVRLPGLIHPRSLYTNHDGPAAIIYHSEKSILHNALEVLKAQGHDQKSLENGAFIALDLEDFTIYRPHSSQKSHKLGGLEERTTANELIALHEVDGRGSSDSWYFDGVVRDGQTTRHLRGISCKIFSIGGLEDIDLHTVGSEIWLLSETAQKLRDSGKGGVYYCLRQPSVEYERYHQPFLWLADLAKHVVDYLHSHDQIFLNDFKKHFHSWLQQTHGKDEIFQQWLHFYKDTDFRRIVAAHATFLRTQALSLETGHESHPLWSEIDPVRMNAVPQQTEQIKTYRSTFKAELSKPMKSISRTKTIVTPFVYECFRHLPWAKFLDPQRPLVRQKQKYPQTSSPVSFRPNTLPENARTERKSPAGLNKADSQTVQVGDVVAINKDTETDWRSKEPLWYGFVQATTPKKQGLQLSLIWLYRPSDTACQNMRYPFSNELFLSDHCNCGDKPIFAHEIISKPKVAFFSDADTSNAAFFVRQKYNGADSAWVTLKTSDFGCVCRTSGMTEQYPIGTILLVATGQKGGTALESVELLDHVGSQIRVRKLDRRTAYDQEADPNELVYTSKTELISTSKICRPCHVRFFTVEEQKANGIPAPYCSKGTGDFYFITSRVRHESETKSDSTVNLCPMSRPWPTSLKQAFDPLSPTSRTVMRGLDIFCGGGSFGRGLEDGGAVQMDWAVDYFKQAIHTYKANDENKDTKLFHGSVNPYLSQAMKGQRGKLVAQAGEVDFIAAGSPCQGYSPLNRNKKSDSSLINISMVASVVAFVDFYRPKYALLENVLGLAKCSHKDKDQNVFAQILCALVALGYQVRPFILDAWSFGCPQSRTRIFISIAAPGLTPLPDPPQSHSHPDGIVGRSLGKTANGLPLGERYWGPTPFKYITIGEATKDLPLNEDGKTDCIRFPDHRSTGNISSINQTRICLIPKHPRGQTFVKSAKLGWQPDTQMKTWDWHQAVRSGELSRAFRRVDPDGLIRTVTTACSPGDGISGEWIHWDDDRPISIMEARRAQGFPDHEVILGAPGMQWKIIGNSVARPVALALGLALRTAWLANADDAIAAAKQSVKDVSVARRAALVPEVQITKRAKEVLSIYRESTDTPDPIAISDSEQYDTAATPYSIMETITRETTTRSEVTLTKKDNVMDVREQTTAVGDQSSAFSMPWRRPESYEDMW